MDIPVALFEELRTACADAHRRCLLSGFNGNASVRMDSACCCITRSGAAKGDIRPADLAIVALADGRILEGSCPSSELEMHLEIYRRCPDARAIVHTHPRHLLALELRVGLEHLLQLPLFEADMLRARLAQAGWFPPGTRELAQAVAQAATFREAVWLSRHGLTCRASDLRTAVALSEELDHLAAIQLLSLPS